MPKPGFKSVTLPAKIYDKWERKLKKGQPMNMFVEDTLLRSDADGQMRFEIVYHSESYVILRDRWKEHEIPIRIPGRSRCLRCNSAKCLHIGFLWGQAWREL